MKARVLFTVAAALALIAACKPDPKPTETFKATLGVSGITGNTISVTADAKEVTFKVSANISWSIDNKANWITVTPASATIDDKQTAETSVKVAIAANEEETAREAVLTIGADGVDPVSVTVKQAGVEKPAVVLQAFDVENFEAIADPAVTVAGLNGAASITIQANVNWTATADEWITVDPAEFTFDGENDLATVTVTAAASADAREGQVKFTAEGAELVVKVSQTAAPTITIEGAEPEYPYSQIAFTITPATETEYFNYIYATKAVFEANGGVDGLVAYMIKRANSYLSSYDAATIMDGLFYQGTINETISDLESETTYVVVAVGIAYDEANNTFVQRTLGASYEATTTTAPTASEAYLANLGTFKGTVYNYFGKANADLTMIVEPLGINETYYLGFPDGIVSPVSQSGVYDRFIAYFNEETGAIDIPAVTESDLGAYWRFNGVDGNCQILLCAFYYKSNDDLESWGFNLSEDKNTLSAFTIPAIPEEDNLLFGGNIVTEAGESTGYAAGYAVVLSDFTRVVEEAPATLSAKSGIVCPSEKSLKTFKVAGKVRK